MSHPEWVEAGARAVRGELLSLPTVTAEWPNEIGRYGACTEHDVARAVIAAVEDDIRADERCEVALDTAAGVVDPDLRAVLEDDMRMKISTEILAFVKREHSETCPCDQCIADEWLEFAARVARRDEDFIEWETQTRAAVAAHERRSDRE